MHIVDFFPLKAAFRPGESIRCQLIVSSDQHQEVVLRLTIWHLDRALEVLSRHVQLSPGEQSLAHSWQPGDDEPRGYGAQCQLLDRSGAELAAAGTAFDVQEHWTRFPRYGFLTDFSPNRADVEQTIAHLARFHINGLQFYDWQFRHDRLLPPTADYVDPLGRELSLNTIHNFIESAHNSGMAAMPYLAVYAASLEFWREHPEWALYDDVGGPLDFMAFLGLMDPTPGRPWSRHLLSECAATLSALPFDGLHVDQYGDPKEAFDRAGEPVDIAAAFSAFIVSLKKAHPEATVAFNAVGNWPIEALATAPVDFVYIEVWPPETSYLDVVEILLNARRLSGDKAVVIALYLPADWPANIRLVGALIFSCGGSRIELGENARLLADPYFPKHQALDTRLYWRLRRYYDFAVRYADLIGPQAGHDETLAITAPAGVWHTVRTNRGGFTISLVNLTGLNRPHWDRQHAAPGRRQDISIGAQMNGRNGRVKQVLAATPDGRDPALKPVAWHQDGQLLTMILPRLSFWALLFVQFEGDDR